MREVLERGERYLMLGRFGRDLHVVAADDPKTDETIVITTLRARSAGMGDGPQDQEEVVSRCMVCKTGEVRPGTAKPSISYPHVTKTPGVCGGKASIGGTRIRVNNVVFLHKDGADDAKIREAYPDLTPAQILAALAYYYDNCEEIDAELAADETWAESLR